MRVLIDLQGAQSDSRFRGIGRYTLSFTKALVEANHARIGKEYEFHLVLNGALVESVEHIREMFRGYLPQENIHLWYPVTPVIERYAINTWRRRASELIREAFIQHLQPDLIHISSFFEGYVDNSVSSVGEFNDTSPPISMLFYDLIPLALPKEYLDPEPRFKKFYERKVKQLKKADVLLGISEFSCQQAVQLLDVSPKKVTNISAASDLIELKNNKNIVADQVYLSGLKINKPFILYTGGGDARKNIRGLIAAFLNLPTDIRNAHQLVLTGHNIDLNEHTQELNSQGLNLALEREKMIVTGYVDDANLIALYRSCAVFVFPSFFEGFGLPPLEAMSFGAPVIAANTTSLPEVIGLDDALFDPNLISSITDKITLVLTNSEFRSRLIEHGLQQAQFFSWQTSANRALEVFDQFLPTKKRFELDVVAANIFAKNIYEKLIDKVATIPSKDGKPTEFDLLHCAHAIAHTFPQKKLLPCLFIDISELVQRDARTGVQRVTRSILAELLEHPPAGYQVEAVYGLTNEPGYRYAKQFVAKLNNMADVNLKDNFIEPTAGDIFLGLDLQHHTTRFQSNFLAQMRRDGVYVCFVVYDLLPIHFPQFWPAEHVVHEIHDEWLRVVCQSDAALCISKAVADELIEWILSNKIPHAENFVASWFHLGATLNTLATSGLPNNAESIITKLKSKPSFLLVGTLEPRKNYAQVLAAFNELWKKGFEINLIIVGKKGWMADDLITEISKHPELNQRFFWVESASDEFLELIYVNSSCLIAPSYGEGFGLPLIEAAQHHLPIIARNLPVFNEVAKDNAFYFDGFNAADLAQAISDWLDLYEKKQHPTSSNLQWQNWHGSTQQLWKRILELKK